MRRWSRAGETCCSWRGMKWRLGRYSFPRDRKGRAVNEMFRRARIMRDMRERPQWAEWRTPRPSSNAKQFPPSPGGAFALEPALVPPNADGNARFHMEFLQNVLD